MQIMTSDNHKKDSLQKQINMEKCSITQNMELINEQLKIEQREKNKQKVILRSAWEKQNKETRDRIRVEYEIDENDPYYSKLLGNGQNSGKKSPAAAPADATTANDDNRIREEAAIVQGMNKESIDLN